MTARGDVVTESPAREVVELGYGGSERLVMNMGPQHPSAHGVFRAILILEGDWIPCALVFRDLARSFFFKDREEGSATRRLDAISQHLARALADTSGLAAVGEVVLHHVIQAVPSGMASLAVAAADGELSIIAGGDVATFDACGDLFKAMGANLFHVGPLGSGLAMKLVNNMLIQVNRVAVAEALVLGVKAGLDPQKIYDVVRVSTGTSYAFEHGVPKILARDFAPGGTVDITYKDQELETAFAKQLGVPLIMANVTQQLYQMARAAGLNKEDGLAVVKILEKLAGVQVGGA